MRNEDWTPPDSATSQLADLQRQITDLQIRTHRLERITREPGRPRTTGQHTSTHQGLVIGDRVRFTATRITAAGTGRITRFVRNFVLIERDDGTTIQRAPKNVSLVDPTGK